MKTMQILTCPADPALTALFGRWTIENPKPVLGLSVIVR